MNADIGMLAPKLPLTNLKCLAQERFCLCIAAGLPKQISEVVECYCNLRIFVSMGFFADRKQLAVESLGLRMTTGVPE